LRFEARWGIFHWSGNQSPRSWSKVEANLTASRSLLESRSDMALQESEPIVLRTYPLREADLLVTLCTRAEGKVRGVARSAKKSKRRFGGAG
jgi:hypothetical protein